jgi:RNA recognition motif-containing protein
MLTIQITSNRKEQKEKKKLNKPLAKKVPRQDKPRSVTSTADRLTVSNLGPNVTQQDVKELFARIGKYITNQVLLKLPLLVITLKVNPEVMLPFSLLNKEMLTKRLLNITTDLWMIDQ